MKRMSILGCVLVVASTLAAAGEVYGTVSEGNSPVAEGAASVAVKCADKSYDPVKTDKYGSYHLVVAAAGKCTLSVTYKQQSGSLDIASYDDAVQYDLALEIKDGKLAVRRK